MTPKDELRVLERSQVSPPPGSVAESTLPLTFLDLIWLQGGAVERVFFYPLPHSTSHFVDSLLPDLKSSLSLALQQFYPLAGKIRRAPENEELYEIHYVDGDSVSFTLAEHGGDFGDISGSHARQINMLLPLLPLLPKAGDDGKPLLAVQVTVFPGKGVAVGVTVHHAACDGSGSMRFMSSWAATCAQLGGSAAASPPPPPIIDKSLLPDPKDLYSLFYKKLLAGCNPVEAIMNQTASPDAVIGNFTLRAEHIRRLKELVSSKLKSTEGSVSFHLSTVVVTFAYVWVCLVKTRAYAEDRVACLGFTADCRARLRPPVPAAYFGNCLSGCLTEVKAGELAGEDGIVAAARAIGTAIEEFKGGPLDGAEEWPEKFSSAAGKQPLSVAGSPKFRVYDVDFGWGRPRKVEITSIASSGAMAVAESREEEGGVEVGLVLPKPEMDHFEAHFYSGLNYYPNIFD